MSTPSTAAGKALLDALTPTPMKPGTPIFTSTTSAWKPWPPDYGDAILAIEAEAAQAERDRLRAALQRIADEVDADTTSLRWRDGGEWVIERVVATLDAADPEVAK